MVIKTESLNGTPTHRYTGASSASLITQSFTYQSHWSNNILTQYCFTYCSRLQQCSLWS